MTMAGVPNPIKEGQTVKAILHVKPWRNLNMAVAPISPAAAAANITAMQPTVYDAFMYGLNLMVDHPLGLMLISAWLISFGVGMGKSFVRGRRRR